VIRTERLDLIPATIPHLRAAIEDSARLGVLLDARVPATWPPDLLDEGALAWTVDRLRDGIEPHWQMHWVVLRESDARTLVGTSGFKGPPAAGTVELGYGIVSDHQRHGYATETVRGLLSFAFADPKVTRVIAETLPELEPSKGVLAKTGFRFIGEGSEPWVIQYEITREEFAP
jgi:ribosomal-protein-alanine N-acetyltransferase